MVPEYEKHINKAEENIREINEKEQRLKWELSFTLKKIHDAIEMRGRFISNEISDICQKVRKAYTDTKLSVENMSSISKQVVNLHLEYQRINYKKQNLLFRFTHLVKQLFILKTHQYFLHHNLLFLMRRIFSTCFT